MDLHGGRGCLVLKATANGPVLARRSFLPGLPRLEMDLATRRSPETPKIQNLAAPLVYDRVKSQCLVVPNLIPMQR